MKLLLLLISHVGAHPLDDPVMSLKIDISAVAVVYQVSVPTFLFDPVKDVTYTSGLDETELRWDAVEGFFKPKNAVSIDGIRVSPILKDLKFVQVDNYEPGAAAEEHKGRLLRYVRADLRLDHPCKGAPREVVLSWNTFLPPELPELFVTLTAFDKRRLIVFSPSANEFVWHENVSQVLSDLLAAGVKRAPVQTDAWITWTSVIVLLIAVYSLRRRLAWLTAVVAAIVFLTLIAIPARSEAVGDVIIPDRETAIKIFEGLHRNIYRAFDYTREDDVYDTLEQSVDGPLLGQIYDQVYQGLLQREEGGAVSMVQQIEFMETAVERDSNVLPEPSAEFRVQCRWRVHGAVEHWGHTHKRLNEYEALYTLKPRQGRWKITAAQVTEQKRIDDKSPP